MSRRERQQQRRWLGSGEQARKQPRPARQGTPLRYHREQAAEEQEQGQDVTATGPIAVCAEAVSASSHWESARHPSLLVLACSKRGG